MTLKGFQYKHTLFTASFLLFLLFHWQLPQVNCQLVNKSIYPEDSKKRSSIYNSLWGEHYRALYSTPITVQSLTLDSLLGGVKVVKQLEELHALYLEDKNQQLYLLKPLGGSTSFIESDFFRDMYNKEDFRNTYTEKFIRDAYTMINPYTFIASDYMAKKIGLSSNNFRLYYLPAFSSTDTIADGSRIQDKLVTVIDIPDINTQKNIYSTSKMLDILHENKSNHVEQEIYIRERLFDMLIGDWNKIPENWNWIAKESDNGIVFTPVVIDRSHAFTKVDGFMFKQLLNILTLGFIFDYNGKYKNIKKFNKLGYPLDVALTAESVETDWTRQAQFIQRTLSDDIIDEAFAQLPENIRGEEIEDIRSSLIQRRNQLVELAINYYNILQETPVLTGSQQNEQITINRSGNDSIRIDMYDTQNGKQVFHKSYTKKGTDEIWLYGLDGNDNFEVKGTPRKEAPIYLIGGKGSDNYHLDSGKKLRIYEYKAAKDSLKELKGVRKIFSDNEKVMGYDYEKTKYHSSSFSPWGFYDSDLGINLGSFYTYTQYGFKRLPFTYQHRIGFNYLTGFMYRGIFPLYNENQTFLLDANFGFPNNFSNFFGFGNKTDGYKDEKNNYNRVNIRELKIIPSFRQKFMKYHQLTVHGSFELYKVLYPDNDRFIKTFYSEDDHIFNYNIFTDVGFEYEFEKDLSRVLNNFQLSFASGWKINLSDTKRNFPYSKAKASIDFRFSKLFTWATMIEGMAIYNDKFDFFHAATTELRGYRDHRFIGKYSVYESSDFRFDLGHLRNPIIPLKYGLFAGMDCGRVWFPGEDSDRWHLSYGGGAWLIILNKIITKYSIFGSSDTVRFMFGLGLGF